MTTVVDGKLSFSAHMHSSDSTCGMETGRIAHFRIGRRGSNALASGKNTAKSYLLLVGRWLTKTDLTHLVNQIFGGLFAAQLQQDESGHVRVCT